VAQGHLGGVALGPEAGHPIVLLVVLQVLSGDAAHQRVARIAIGEQRADGEQYFGDGESRGPVVFEDVEADHALAVDVAVVNSCAEQHLRGFEGVLRGEVYVEEEDTTLVDGAGGAQDGGDPLVQVVSFGSRRAVRRWVQSDLRQLLLDAPCAGAEGL